MSSSEMISISSGTHWAGGLEVGGGVSRGTAISTQHENPSGLGLLLLGVLEEHPGVVPLGLDVVGAGVVDL